MVASVSTGSTHMLPLSAMYDSTLAGQKHTVHARLNAQPHPMLWQG